MDETETNLGVLETPESFEFPFPPYDIQQKFMQNLYFALENRKFGIFESPTGTGKSLSIICGAIRWLKDHNIIERNTISQVISKLESEKQKVASEETDWLVSQSKERELTDKLNLLKIQESKILQYDKKIENLMKVKEMKVNKKWKQLNKNRENKTENLNDVEEKNVEDDDILLDELNLKEDYYSSDDDEKEVVYEPVKIFIASRTHSQLSQFVGEIIKSPFGKDVRVISLASRQTYCINPSVTKLKSMALINERCLDMQKKKPQQKIGEEGKVVKKQKVASCSCPYYKQTAIEELQEFALVQIQDVEDLVSSGKELNACPYYASRRATEDAEVVLIPYNTLLHKATREANGVKLKNNIVIIDEAHNLLDALAQMHNAELSYSQVYHALHQMRSYKNRFNTRFSAKNLLMINQLIYVINQLFQMFEKHITTNTTDIFTIENFVLTANIDNYNMFKLTKFCKECRLAQKVRSYALKYPVEENQEIPPKGGVKEFLASIQNKKTEKKQTVDETVSKKIVIPPASNPLLAVLSFLESLTYSYKEFASKMELVRRKLAFDLEKSKVQMMKLKRYVIDPVDKHPIIVKGINDATIELITVRQRAMSPVFSQMLKLVEEKLIEEASKGRPPERIQQALKQQASRPPKTAVLEYFLLSLSPSVIECRLGPKFNRVLKKYRDRKEKWDKRWEEWEDFFSKKPIPGKNHPDDEKLLGEARENIGDYKLKESEDYKPPPDSRETTVKKYKQLLDARLKQYNLRHEFIQKVWDIRDLKYKIRDRLIQQRENLLALNDELPENFHKFGPAIPSINTAEFPEEKVIPKIILPEEEIEIVETSPVQEFVPEPDSFRLERELLPERSNFPKILNNKFTSSFSVNDTEGVLESDFNALLEFSEETDTPMEMEIRVKRLNRLLFHQDQTVSAMHKEIEDFNNTIIEAKKERLPIHVGGNFIDIYILTLNQELNILKEFEDGEDQLSKKVNDNLTLVHKLEDEIDMLKNKKEEHESEIDDLHDAEHKIQDKFRHAAETNKYFDFLKKVFRKKYKPPKQVTDDESSSESSSSSSEESDFDDSASIDSRDFGFIRQDLNVCPKGCEVAIYNLTVDLRSKRHEVELSIREQNRILETVKKDIELANRKLNILHNQLRTSQNDLEKYQREKQKLLNQVRCTVVLKMDQIHDYNPEIDEINKYLVFSKTALSDLYKRVGTLQHENFQQRSKYELYHKHLTRMKKDIRYMNQKIKDLKNHMRDSLLERFGRVVEIDEITMTMEQQSFHKSHVNELDEVVLKKLVYDLRMKSTDIKEMYLSELNNWNSKISNAQEELAQTIKENTKRLELLHVINKEKKNLVKIIMLQPKKKEQIEKILETHSLHLKELKKLEDVIEAQSKQLQELKIEIKILKTKGLPPKSEVKEEFESVMKRKEEKDEDGTKEWMDYDKYIEREDDVVQEQRPIQDINIPGFYTSETEDIVREVVKEIFDKTVSKETLNVGQTVKSILSGIMLCTSVQDIINEIINSLPFEPDEKQKSFIDTAAEKLHQIQEPEPSDESFARCAKELLEDTIDEVLLVEGEVHEVIANLVEKLIESVPTDYLLKEDSIESIVQKVSDTLGNLELDKENLVKAIENIPSVYKEEMLSILNVILDRVFGTGLDYLYVVKYD